MAGGCLGEGEYDVRFIRRRTLATAAYPIGEAAALSGSWGRSLSATSDASLQFGLSGDGGRCGQILAQLDPWRHEAEVYRSGLLVWVGPVQDVIEDPSNGTATVTAKDLSAWWARRVLHQAIVSRQQDLASIFGRYIAMAFEADDPGVTVEASPTGILGDRTIAASDVKRLDVELAELARNGVDWTVANRVFYVGGQEVSPAGRLPGRLVDEHFRQAPQTRRSGAGMVNSAYVRGNKVVGHYGGPDADGVLLEDVADESNIEDQGSADASAQSWWDLSHEPLVFLEGQNALAPSAPVELAQLIPGVVSGIDLQGYGVVPVHQDLRLERLVVTFGPDEEEVQVGFQPVGTVAGEG